MAWKKGQSGNPAGSPGKKRALTEILEKAGNRTVPVGDKRMSRKRLLARLAWDIATYGKTTFPDGTELILDPADWLQIFKFIYQHIDGPPKTEVDINNPDGPLCVIVQGPQNESQADNL